MAISHRKNKNSKTSKMPSKRSKEVPTEIIVIQKEISDTNQEMKSRILSLGDKCIEDDKSTEDISKRIDGSNCLLCRYRNKVPYLLQRHVFNVHLKHSCKFYNNLYCYLCKLNDCGIKSSILSKAHYHCPVLSCDRTSFERERIVTHFKFHRDVKEFIVPAITRNRNEELISIAIETDENIKAEKILETFNGISIEENLLSEQDFALESVIAMDMETFKGQTNPLGSENLKNHDAIYKQHISIGECLPESKHSNILLKYIHEHQCLLCDRKMKPLSLLMVHVWSVHMKRYYKTKDNLYGFLCRLNCDGKQTRQGHYHCPLCSMISKSVTRVENHIENHVRFKKPKPIQIADLIDVKESVKNKKVMSKVVDELMGIYMVTSTDDATSPPMHVVANKDDDGVSTNYFCTLEECHSAMLLAWENGSPDYICQHIKRIIPKAEKSSSWYIKGFKTRHLSNREQKIFRDGLESIVSITSNPVVPWKFSNQCTFFSVICEKNSSFPLGRLLVKYNCSTRVFLCDCSLLPTRIKCFHILLCKIYCKQVKFKLNKNVKRVKSSMKCNSNLEDKYILIEKADLLLLKEELNKPAESSSEKPYHDIHTGENLFNCSVLKSPIQRMNHRDGSADQSTSFNAVTLTSDRVGNITDASIKNKVMNNKGSPSEVFTSSCLNRTSKTENKSRVSCKFRHDVSSIYFKELMDDKDFVDVTLTVVSDGRSIKAHRIVLARMSSYFSELLRANSGPNPIFIMPSEIPFHDLSKIIEYIYTGEVNVSHELMDSFLKSAKLLNIHNLNYDQNFDNFDSVNTENPSSNNSQMYQDYQTSSMPKLIIPNKLNNKSSTPTIMIKNISIVEGIQGSNLNDFPLHSNQNVQFFTGDSHCTNLDNETHDMNSSSLVNTSSAGTKKRRTNTKLEYSHKTTVKAAKYSKFN